MKKLTVAQLLVLLTEGKIEKGCSFAGLDTVTVPTLLGGKKNEMQGRVNKITQGSLVLLFSNANSNGYENMINRRLKATQGESAEPFKVGALAWGEKIPNTPLIVHTNKKGETNYYIQTIFSQCAKTLKNVAIEMGLEINEKDSDLIDQIIVGYEGGSGKTHYELDGEKINKDQIIGLGGKKTEGEQGGLGKDSKVIIRTYKLSSLMRITVGGETYIIEN